MGKKTPSHVLQWLAWLAWIPVTLALCVGIVRLVIGKFRSRSVDATPFAPDYGAFSGLTEDEVNARRRPSQEKVRKDHARKVRRDIWRFSTFSIFNMSMLGLAIVQWILNDPLSALLTLGIMFLNIGLNVVQQLYATNKVEALLATTTPMAAAIRDRRIKSVPVDEIVVDDLLVAGAGDQFLADGEVVSGRPQVFAESSEDDSDHRRQQSLLDTGDAVGEGNYCLNGRAIYRVTGLPSGSEGPQWSPVRRKSELTPLQNIITRILHIMLLLIALFLGLLFLDMADLPFLSTILESQYRETASIFFSIAPSGLFFMIIATYAVGSARLGEDGAVVRDTKAVESLGQISVLCFGKTGALTGAMVHMQMAEQEEGDPMVAENLARNLLGDTVHNVRGNNVLLQALSENFQGSGRPVHESVDLFSAYGWSGVTFAEDDVNGTFIVGEPGVLAPYLSLKVDSTEGVEEDGAGDRFGTLRSSFNRISNRIRRDEDIEESDSPDGRQDQAALDHEPPLSQDTLSINEGGEIHQESNGGLLQRLQLQIAERTTRSDGTNDRAGTEEDKQEPAPTLLFAYTEDEVSLIDQSSTPQLPGNLRPICTLHFEEGLRPEAKETAKVFSDAGVVIKIVSSDQPERVIKTAEELGLIQPAESGDLSISGKLLAKMSETEFESAVANSVVFFGLSSRQNRQVVTSLRQQGERVAVVGDGAGDVMAMSEADLSLTFQSSSQAAVNTADIILMDDSFDVLPAVLARGQRIVNGMLDIIKINLVQIGYISLLILAMIIANRRIFYYHPTQGGIIAFFTVVVPSLGLTFWASTGSLPRQYMSSRLAHFVIPGAITAFIAALAVTLFFNRTLTNIETSYMAVTHALILIGLLLVVFVQPPTRFWVGGDVYSGDWRSTYMAIVLLVLFIVATYLPITQKLFRLRPLMDAREYLIIIAIALVWTFAVRLIWRMPWLDRYTGILTRRLEGN